MRLEELSAALCASLILVACAGDKASETGTAEAPTFSEIRGPLVLSCGSSVSCHAEGSVSGMELAPGGEYDALVNAPSVNAPGQTLVIPNDADGSYLIRKLEDADGIVGSPMPPPFGGYDPAEIEKIRAWIDAGALDN